MKPIALALASLLWTSSAFAAEESGQLKNASTQKNLISSADKEKRIHSAPQSGINVGEQSARAGTSTSSTQNLSQADVPRPTKVPPRGEHAQRAAPVSDSTKGVEPTQAKHPPAAVKETVFKEICGSDENSHHCPTIARYKWIRLKTPCPFHSPRRDLVGRAMQPLLCPRRQLRANQNDGW